MIKREERLRQLRGDPMERTLPVETRFGQPVRIDCDLVLHRDEGLGAIFGGNRKFIA